jgi:predicted transcriptional regulator
MDYVSPLDDVEFLARSSHRVVVVQLLQKGPWTRPDIHEETGISQPTLGRVLGSLVDRNWVEQVGREYQFTPVGALVAEEFIDLLDTLETFHQLGDVIDFLPVDRLDLDVRSLGGATVTAPEPSDVLKHIRRLEELVFDADRVRILTPTMLPDSVDKLLDRHDGVGSLYHEAIFTGDAVEIGLANPGLVASARELLDTHSVDLFRYDGTVELMLASLDETAVIGPLDEQGLPRAFVESEDETVRSWVEAKLDEYRDASTPITSDDLPP